MRVRSGDAAQLPGKAAGSPASSSALETRSDNSTSSRRVRDPPGWRHVDDQGSAVTIIAQERPTFGLFVSATQPLANKHVQTIQLKQR
ncbi:MAG: hypothetical protein WBQ66_11545 [Blastocatellia bacterium]